MSRPGRGRSGGAAGRDGLHVEAPDLLKLKRDLAGVSKDLVAELRKGLKAAADPIRRLVQGNARFSKRIPKAVTIGTKFTKRSTGVFVRINANRAPHARPINNDDRPGTFRHPVHGNKEVWAEQRAVPLFAGVDAETADIEQSVLDVMDRVARKAGFK